VSEPIVVRSVQARYRVHYPVLCSVCTCVPAQAAAAAAEANPNEYEVARLGVVRYQDAYGQITRRCTPGFATQSPQAGWPRSQVR
jgi:hypothetical protein